MDERELGEKCEVCRKRYLTIYEVSDDLWKKITSKNDSLGLLCPSCIDAMAREKGIELYWEAAERNFPVWNFMDKLDELG